MPKISRRAKRGGALAVALALFLAIYRTDNTEIALACVGIFCCVVYAFSDYPSTTENWFVKLVRWAFLVAACAFVAGLACYYSWKRWTLEDSQREAVTKIAKEMPRELSLVVEYPPAYNKLGQQFGKEIRQVFESSGARVNKITVVHGALPDFEGMIVNVPQPPPLNESKCVSYRYGSALSSVMAQAGIKSTLLPNSSIVDCSSLAIFVGKKPSDHP
jgi:hypothetical protein